MLFSLNNERFFFFFFLISIYRQQFFLNLVIDFQDGRIRVTDKDLALKLTALIAQSEHGDYAGSRPNSPTDPSSPLSNSLSSLLLHYRKWLPFSLFESKDLSTSNNAHATNDNSSSNFSNRTGVNSHFSPLTSRKHSSPATVVASGSDDHRATNESPGQCNRSRRKHASGHSDHGGDGGISSSEEGESESAFSFSAPSSPYESLLLMSTSPLASRSSLAAARSFSLDTASTAQVLNSSYDEELPIICDSVARIHRTLKGMKQSHAKYLFLKEVSNLDDFGVEYFQVKSNITNDHSSDHCLYKLGIGPKGVTIEAANNQNSSGNTNNPVIALAVASVDLESSHSSPILTEPTARTNLNSAITQLPSPPGVNLPVPQNAFSSKTRLVSSFFSSCCLLIFTLTTHSTHERFSLITCCCCCLNRVFFLIL